MALADIVQVTISTEATAPTRVGFGTPLVFGYHTTFAERARVYTSTAAMVADGFATTSPAYRAAVAIFSQSPKVRRIVVGRAAFAPTMKVVLTPIVQNTHLYTVTINGVSFTFTSDASATAAEITAGLVAAINAGAEPVTAVDLVGTFRLDADVAGVLFTLEVLRADLTQSNTTVDPGIVADLLAIQQFNDEWYSVHPTSQGAAEILALAAQVETMTKIMIVSSADDVLPAGTAGLGESLETAGYARTALLYHPKPHQYAGAAWAGKLLPLDPGSATWKFKTLAGVDTVSLTDTEEGNLEADNVNHYTEVAGVSITQQGVSSSGEFIDITTGVDFLTARLQENVFARLANLAKVPFTDAGIAIIEAEVRGVLQLGIDNDILAADPAPTVTVPLAADVSLTDKANRFLPDVEFTATLAGAIHSLEINGSVTV